MIGGMICPPVDAAASTAPAKFLSYPVFFIIGIVMDPVVTVFPTEDPETIPHSAEETTATLAGPPAKRPVSALANAIKYSDIPVFSKNAPKIMNTTMYFEQTFTGVENRPFSL